jgi:hypothetical protein
MRFFEAFVRILGRDPRFLTPMKQNVQQIEEDTIAFSLTSPKWPGSLVVRSQLRELPTSWALRDDFA